MTPLVEILKNNFNESDFIAAIPFLQKLREVLDRDRSLS
jgi:hypothetical protein